MDLALTAVVTLGAFVALATSVLWLRGRLLARRYADRRSPEQKAADDAHHKRRLETPDWEAVKRATGGSPSPALHHLYGDPTLLHRQNFYLRNLTPHPDYFAEEHINVFYPADELVFHHPWYHVLPSDSLPIATDLSGDLIFVRMTSDGSDGPVLHWYHDGGDIATVAPSLEIFLGWGRYGTALGEDLP